MKIVLTDDPPLILLRNPDMVSIVRSPRRVRRSLQPTLRRNESDAMTRGRSLIVGHAQKVLSSVQSSEDGSYSCEECPNSGLVLEQGEGRLHAEVWRSAGRKPRRERWPFSGNSQSVCQIFGVRIDRLARRNDCVINTLGRRLFGEEEMAGGEEVCGSRACPSSPGCG